MQFWYIGGMLCPFSPANEKKPQKAVHITVFSGIIYYI